MYIRALIGAYSGEIRDVAYDSAKRLIDSGQATAVDFNPTVRSERVEGVSIEGEPVTSTDTVPAPELVSIEPKKRKNR
jgi:hypothetical protein